MRERLIYGPVMIAALVGGLWLDEAIGMLVWRSGLRGVVVFAVVFLLAMLGVGELVGIFRLKGIEVSRALLSFAATVGLLVMWPKMFQFLLATNVDTTSYFNSFMVLPSAAVLVLMVSMIWGVRHKSPRGVIAVSGAALLTFVYLGLMPGFISAFRAEHSAWALLWVLLVIKSCDIGAYFTGKSIGKHKMIPWLSPGKTWEGLVGGVVLAMVVATLGLVGYRSWVGVALAPVWFGPIAGGLFAVLGQVGDLMASAFKRDAGLKDSGHSIPGFGGVLDVIDSPLLVVPVAYWALAIVRSG